MRLSEEQIDFLNNKATSSVRTIGNQWQEVSLTFSNFNAYCEGIYIIHNCFGIHDSTNDDQKHTIKFKIKPADHAKFMEHVDVDFIADVLGVPRKVVTETQPQRRAPVWELRPVKGYISHHSKSMLAMLGGVFEEKNGALVYDGGPSSKVFIANPLSKLQMFGFEGELFDIDRDQSAIRRMTATERGVERMAEVGFVPAMRLLMRQHESQALLSEIDKVQAAISRFGGTFIQGNNIKYSMPFDDEEAVRQTHIYALLEGIGGKPFAVKEGGKAYLALPADNAGKLAILGIDALRGLGTRYECVDTAYQAVVKT